MAKSTKCRETPREFELTAGPGHRSWRQSNAHIMRLLINH